MKTNLENIATALSGKKLSFSEKRNELVNAISVAFPNVQVIHCNFEKPATGRVFGVKEMSDRYRINYRCGYGRWNYAPCIEVMK